MGFKENLLKKIKINQLSDEVLRSMGPPESGRRLDHQPMRELLEMGDYTYRRERDLDLYLQAGPDGTPVILVLDNELKRYQTSVEDVVLRKSPTTKEMINIRNAIKILNDKKVVLSRKGDTVEQVRTYLIGALDLSYGPADIENLAQDGRDALQNNYADGILETLSLFAELLGYVNPPKAYRLAHHQIWGKLKNAGLENMQYGPLVSYNLMQSTLAMFLSPIGSQDKNAIKAFQIAAGNGKADLEGPDVWEALKKSVLESPPPI